MPARIGRVGLWDIAAITATGIVLLLLSKAADNLPVAKRLKVRSASSHTYSIYIVELARTRLRQPSA